MFSLICAWIYSWVNNRETGDLRRHRAHYDVKIMIGPLIRCGIHDEHKGGYGLDNHGSEGFFWVLSPMVLCKTIFFLFDWKTQRHTNHCRFFNKCATELVELSVFQVIYCSLSWAKFLSGPLLIASWMLWTSVDKKIVWKYSNFNSIKIHLKAPHDLYTIKISRVNIGKKLYISFACAGFQVSFQTKRKLKRHDASHYVFSIRQGHAIAISN